MRWAAFVLICLLQQDAKIREWIRGLEDDSVETRDKSFAALVEAGAAAEPEIRKAAEQGSAEVRARAEDALRAIGWKRRYDPGPSRITLRREKAPLKEVLAELRRQTPTLLKFETLDPPLLEMPVTADLDKAPLYRALEAICRSHGKVDYDPHCGWGDDPTVDIREGTFAACPRVVDGAIELQLKRIISNVTLRPGGGREEETEFDFEWSWETGTRPLGGRVEIEEVRDEAGKAYLGRLEPVKERFRADHVDTDLERRMPCVPPEGVARFSVIKGTFVVVLPLTVHEFVFEAPIEKVGETRESRWGNVKLAECEAGTRVYHVKVETRPEALIDRLKVALLDQHGREFSGFGTGLGHMRDHGFWKVDCTKEEGRTPSVLRCTAEVGRRERRIPFEFKDVRFR